MYWGGGVNIHIIDEFKESIIDSAGEIYIDILFKI